MEWSDHFSTAAKRTSKIGSGGGAAATLTWVSGAEELVISVRQAAAWCNISRYVVLAWMIQGTYQIEADGWEDATDYLVVRGTAEDDPNLVIIPGLVPLVNKQTGEIEYVVAHTEWDRLDAMTPVSG